MPRWLTWSLLVGGGCAVGFVAGPCLLGAVGDLMTSTSDAQGPGFVGLLAGVVVGPILGGIAGAVVAWRVTRPSPDETLTDDPAADDAAVRA